MGISPWYWRSLSLAGRTGSQVFQALFHHPSGIGTLLESASPHCNPQSPLSHYSLCAGSPRLINGKLQLWTPSVGKILPFLTQLLTEAQSARALQSGDGSRSRCGRRPISQNCDPAAISASGLSSPDQTWPGATDSSCGSRPACFLSSRGRPLPPGRSGSSSSGRRIHS